MASVIIYTNENGGVSVCVPTGELDIYAVQAKDTPAGSIIVDDNTLPKGTDAKFFDAWVLNNLAVTVYMPKAISLQTSILNRMAYAEAQHRTAKAGAGLANVLSDADWAALLATARTAVTEAANTDALVAAVAPVEAAVAANAL